MVNNRPTVYNTSSVYAEAGGGGGEPIPDPDIYQRAEGLKRNSANFGLGTGTDFIVNNLDKIFIKMYFTSSASGQSEILKMSGRYFYLQWVDVNTIRVNGDYVTLRTPNYLTVVMPKNNEFILNNMSFTAGSYTAGDKVLGSIWQDSYSYTNGSILFELSIFDKDGNPKYKFVPYKRKTDNKIGLLEIYTNYFVVAPNDWELVGLYP